MMMSSPIHQSGVRAAILSASECTTVIRVGSRASKIVCVCGGGGGEISGRKGSGMFITEKSSGRHRMSETQPAGHYPKGYCGGCSLDIVVVCHQLFSVFGC